MIRCNIDFNLKEASIYKNEAYIETKSFANLNYKKETSDDIACCNKLSLINKLSIYLKIEHGAKEVDTLFIISDESIYKLLKPNDMLIKKLTKSMKREIKNNELKLILGSTLFEMNSIKNVDLHLCQNNNTLKGDGSMFSSNFSEISKNTFNLKKKKTSFGLDGDFDFDFDDSPESNKEMELPEDFGIESKDGFKFEPEDSSNFRPKDNLNFELDNSFEFESEDELSLESLNDTIYNENISNSREDGLLDNFEDDFSFNKDENTISDINEEKLIHAKDDFYDNLNINNEENLEDITLDNSIINIEEEIDKSENQNINTNIFNNKNIDVNDDLKISLLKEFENMEKYIDEQINSLEEQAKELESKNLNLKLNFNDLSIDENLIIENFNKSMEIRLRLKVIKKSCKIYSNIKAQLKNEISTF